MVRFLSLLCSFLCSLGKSTGRTGAHAVGFRCAGRFRCSRSWRQVEFGPYGLARHGAEFDAPAVGEGFDEEKAASGLTVGGGWLAAREVVAARVRHLDTEGLAARQDHEPEVPSGETSVGGGVRGELGHQVLRGLRDAVRQAPGAQPLDGEEPGEAGAAWRGGQQDAEVTCRSVELGGLFLVHVTERGGACLP